MSSYVVRVDNHDQEEAMNVVTLIGNVATDVELRSIGEEQKVASFLLAVDRPRDKGTDFVRVCAWNRQAETCARHLGKGRRVAVDGRLRSRSWEEPDGKRRSAVDVSANRVEFLDGPASGERGAPERKAGAGAARE